MKPFSLKKVFEKNEDTGDLIVKELVKKGFMVYYDMYLTIDVVRELPKYIQDALERLEFIPPKITIYEKIVIIEHQDSLLKKTLSYKRKDKNVVLATVLRDNLITYEENLRHFIKEF